MQYLIVIITNRCNFSCGTCLRGHGKRDDIDLNLLRKVLLQARKLGYRQIRITGGEPALHPRFFELLELVVKNGFTFSLVTNGSLIDKYKEVIEKFGQSLDRCTVSLDGASASIHESIRDKGSYQKAIDMIKFLVSSNIRNSVQTCLNHRNLHNIAAIVGKAAELGADEVRFVGTIHTKDNSILWLSNAEKAKARDKIESLRKKNKIKVGTSTSLGGAWGVDFCIGVVSLTELAVNPMGQLVFCCDTISDGAVIGDLNRESLLKLYLKALDWSSYLRKKRAQLIANGRLKPDYDSCEFCNTMLAERIN